MPRHTEFTPPKSRTRRMASKAAKQFAETLRRLDLFKDFTIMHEKQEVVVSRNEKSHKEHEILDTFRLVAKVVAEDGTLDDVHMHYDGNSLSLYFTETVMPV